MKTSFLVLVFLGTFACKTTAGISNQKSNSNNLVSPKAATVPGAVIMDTDSHSLLKWRVGRWSLLPNPNGAVEKKDKPGSVACDILASDVKAKLGAAKLAALEQAIAVVYPLRDSRQTSPIFRGLENSRELVAVYKGNEFLIEKMFQARDAIVPGAAGPVGKDLPASSIQAESLDTIMEIATNPLICAKIPN